VYGRDDASLGNAHEDSCCCDASSVVGAARRKQATSGPQQEGDDERDTAAILLCCPTPRHLHIISVLLQLLASITLQHQKLQGVVNSIACRRLGMQTKVSVTIAPHISRVVLQ